jgi:hypothetical protein
VRDVRLESIVDYHGDRRGHGVVNSRGGVVSEMLRSDILKFHGSTITYMKEMTRIREGCSMQKKRQHTVLSSSLRTSLYSNYRELMQ